jgi:hypothetical protein
MVDPSCSESSDHCRGAADAIGRLQPARGWPCSQCHTRQRGGPGAAWRNRRTAASWARRGDEAPGRWRSRYGPGSVAINRDQRRRASRRSAGSATGAARPGASCATWHWQGRDSDTGLGTGGAGACDSDARAPRQVQRLASVLGRLGQLLLLSLRANRLGSDGLKGLAPALRRTLTDLDLADNGIGPDGITALAVRLSDVTGLTRLDLSRNHFSAVLGDSDCMDHHSERALIPLAPAAPGAAAGGGAGAGGPAARAGAARGSKTKYSAGFRTVAKKMSEAGSEVRRARAAGRLRARRARARDACFRPL